MTSSSRLLTKGPRIGRCNICGDYGPLTEDHTPPKGCVHPTQVEMQHITAALSQEPSQTRGAYSQNGVKYRTLCGVCNNTRLGARYDPHLISFVNAIGQVLRSQIYLPNSLTLNVRPQPVVRAILGHMAAQGVDRYEKGPLTAEFRSYLLALFAVAVDFGTISLSTRGDEHAKHGLPAAAGVHGQAVHGADRAPQ